MTILLLALLGTGAPGSAPAPVAVPAPAHAPALSADTLAVVAGASLPVHPDHWVVGALARLDALPGAEASLPWGVRSPRREAVVRALEAVAEAGEGEAAALARAYLARLLEEFGGTGEAARDPAAGPFAHWISGEWALALGRRYGALGTGQGRYEYVPPEPLGEARHLAGGASGALALGPLALAGRIRIGEDGEPEVREAYVAGRAFGVDLWAGRRTPGFGGTRAGSMVLSGRVPLEGGGFALADPATLPGFLRHLGPLRFETHLARFDRSGDIGRPWFWSARGSIAPHPRFALAINRAAMFGGEGAPPMSVRNVILTLLGTRAADPSGDFPKSGFANQVASLEVRWRPPVGALPATLYVEWGMEDSAGAWWTVPGIVAGVRVAALPWAPALSLGLEHTHFAPECCQNPPWYRHAVFSGGWAEGGIPLGHPLGGEGDEWLLHGDAHLADARLRAAWRLFLRERRGDNLYAPDREGRSRGVGAAALWRVGARTDLTLEATYERGRGAARWSELEAFVGVRAYF